MLHESIQYIVILENTCTDTVIHTHIISYHIIYLFSKHDPEEIPAFSIHAPEEIPAEDFAQTRDSV